MTKRTVVGTVVAVAVVAAAAGGGWWWYDQGQRKADQAAQAAITAYAKGWQKRSFGDVTFESAVGNDRSPAEWQADFDTVTSGLGKSTPVTVKAEPVSREGDRASSTFRVTWTLAGGVPWTYTVPVKARLDDSGDWRIVPPVDASPWHPELKPGDKLTATRTWGTRGDLLDLKGKPLMPMGKVYPVQLDPGRANADTARALEKIVDEPAGSLVAKLQAAQKSGSKAPIAVITYRQADFDARRDKLDALKGVIYPAREQPLASSRTFGQPLLGSFGPVNAEMVDKGKGRYAVGDFAGTSGLQGQYDSVLGGTAGVKVVSSGRPSTPMFEKAAVDGLDVQTTLDPTVQAAAEKALTGTKDIPSALVAVDVKSGGVLASANSPALGFDRAITGRYPPGSAFKVATTYALLTGNKVTPTTQVSCPKTLTVDGRSFKNFEGGAITNPTFAEDFAQSCNTAFIQLADKLGDDDLAKAATALGIGTGWGKALGVANAFDGSVPTNNGKTDKASASIGQGRNLVSPLALAQLAANVARGSTVPPSLVTEPKPADDVDRTPKPLDPKVVTQLQSLMRGVVTSGSGTAVKDVPGGPVHGKSGTAEFGDKNPPETHAWFIGYQGDVAFAVLVEKGRSGGSVAAPVAKAFLTELAR
ncbi:penicillin-binding transpeptidase domain-containing protein [Knoellia koreensis]|uniref:Penicillin-binding protein 2 n=1 Tax=Knoellia koreensis TaxID=2730921 RepID=A0A849HJ47_9MICO|nr:penicillin-binding transpeptidase domain-containing protein [Knoellia sp. DB2414S]NNM47292.1 penicillin-binding protein 2 [Knoellia sp. DB2414S]